MSGEGHKVLLRLRTFLWSVINILLESLTGHELNLTLSWQTLVYGVDPAPNAKMYIISVISMQNKFSHLQVKKRASKIDKITENGLF